MRVVYLGLTPSAEQDLIDKGVDIEYLRNLQLHEGEVCEAQLSIGTSDEWEENYYDLMFSDGLKFYECSGYHLEEVK